MSLVGNIIWFIFGGLFMALEYFVASLLLMLTIVGIPFGLQTFKLGILALWPFGRKTIPQDGANGCFSVVMNVWWLVFGGLVIAISHVGWGILFFVTIVGIPFGKQHFKLAALALTPFGRQIVPC